MLRHVLVERPNILKAEREKAQVPLRRPAFRLCPGKQRASANLAVQAWGARNVCAMASVGSGWTASALIGIARVGRVRGHVAACRRVLTAAVALTQCVV